MRVGLIGATNLTARCLDELSNLEGVDVVGIVTAPRKFTISYAANPISNVQHYDFTEMKDCDIPILVTDSGMSNSNLLEEAAKWEPDAWLIAGWYHMVPSSWRDVAPAYGIHASALPKYAGGAPLVWQMIQGEPEAGVTLFRLDDGVDSGPILDQAKTAILSDDSIATLISRIETLAVEIVRSALPKLARGQICEKPQDQQQRTVMPQRGPDDGQIDWNWPATLIDRWIRAQTKPYPGAFTELAGERITVWSAQLDDQDVKGPPGQVVCDEEGHFVVKCGVGSIALGEISYRGEVLTGPELEVAFVDGSVFLESKPGAMPRQFGLDR